MQGIINNNFLKKSDIQICIMIPFRENEKSHILQEK